MSPDVEGLRAAVADDKRARVRCVDQRAQEGDGAAAGVGHLRLVSGTEM